MNLGSLGERGRGHQRRRDGGPSRRGVYADPNGIASGASYVVFGKNTATASAFPANLELSTLDGATGFRIAGVADGERRAAR